MAALGRRVDLSTARVELDGALVPVAPDLVYYLLNKPDGVITTADDPQGRPTVVTLVPAEPRVFPVGRLDRHTEGLLVLTNDGALAQLLTHPSHGVAKEYVVEVERRHPGAGRAARAAPGRRARGRADRAGRGRGARARACCASSSTRAATARSAACATPSATRCAASCAPASARCATRTLPPGRWRHLGADEVRALAAAAGARPHRQARRTGAASRAAAPMPVE